MYIFNYSIFLVNWPFCLLHNVVCVCASCESLWLEVYSVCISTVILDLLGYHLHRIYFSILLAYVCPCIWSESPRQHIVGYCCFSYSATSGLSARKCNPFTFEVIAGERMACSHRFLHCFLCVLPVTLPFSHRRPCFPLICLQWHIFIPSSFHFVNLL